MSIPTVNYDLRRLGVELRQSIGAPKVYPPAEPRPCEYCSETFTPRDDKTDRAKFCSRRCSDRGRGPTKGPVRQAGKWITCAYAECDRTFWRYDSQMQSRASEFCCSSHWTRHRCSREHRYEDRSNLEPLVRSGSWVGIARQRYLGTKYGRIAGHLGGRPPGVTASDAQIRTVRLLRERDPGIGRIRLARLAGLTTAQVRGILDDLKETSPR